MNTQTHVLIAESFNNGIQIGGSTPFFQPPNRVDWASNYDELTWTLSIAGITDGGSIGAPANTLPTAFSVTARFEYRQMHAGVFYRFQIPRWTNMRDEEISSHKKVPHTFLLRELYSILMASVDLGVDYAMIPEICQSRINTMSL